MHREVIQLNAHACRLQEAGYFPVGLLFGYGAYTTLRLPIADEWLDAHLNRLAHDARSLGLDWRYSHTLLKKEIRGLYQPEEPVIRLSAFADVDGYGDFYSAQPIPCRLLISTRSAPMPSVSGLSLQSADYGRPLPAIKTGPMADLILLKRQARAAGFDDVLFINRQGCISEASTANVFLIRDGALHTPDPQRDGCLPGITRLQVLQAASQAGVATETGQPLPLVLAKQAEGAFLCNAAQGIIPVRRIDDTPLPWPPSAQTVLKAMQENLPLIQRQLND